jgi:hypothetical protein
VATLAHQAVALVQLVAQAQVATLAHQAVALVQLVAQAQVATLAHQVAVLVHVSAHLLRYYQLAYAKVMQLT